MKLFDYKFLILLALTLVVYFMFREIIDLRNKIDNLESKVNTIEYNPNQPVVKKQMEIKPAKVIESKPVFQIPLPKPPVEEKPEIGFNKILSTIKEQDNDETEIESESNIDSSNIEKLEIYSNDNIEDNIDDFSIGESSEIDLVDIEDQLVNESNSESKDSEVLMDSDNSKEKEEDKKKNLLVETEGTKILETINENLQRSSDLEIDNLINSNSQSDHSSVVSTTLSYKNLMKMKLAQLQCMAEENNISLSKNDNGKKKTKSELSKELLTCFDV
tara:strand:+ start:314 stop:1135 length:822 start_codon:yes stop_codon:yes gene_type:complete